MTKQDKIVINEEFKSRAKTWLTELTEDKERINFESAGAVKKGSMIGNRFD